MRMLCLLGCKRCGATAVFEPLYRLFRLFRLLFLWEQ